MKTSVKETAQVAESAPVFPADDAEAREARLERLRAAVSSGAYEVPANLLSSRLVDAHIAEPPSDQDSSNPSEDNSLAGEG